MFLKATVVALGMTAFSLTAIAQNPNTAQYPAAIASDSTFLVAGNNAFGLLSAPITSLATSLTVSTPANFITPTALTIESEIVMCTTLTGNTFSGCTRGWQGTIAAAHLSGANVYGNIISYYHNQVAAELKAIEGALGTYFNGGGINAKASNYTLAASDNTTLVTFNGSSLTATLPASPPSAKWTTRILNLNSTALTVSPNGLTINGLSASVMVPQYQSANFWTDGSNYFGYTTVGSTGSGTVTAVTFPTIPSWLTASVATNTTTPAISVTPTSGQSPHLVIGTCGAGTVFAPCSLVAGDLPVIPLSTGISGILGISNGGTGTASPGLVAGTNVTITGSWPNQTINSSGGGGGLADPGANGVMKRTALNVTAPAVAADIVTLFSTCSGIQYLGADGACHTASGSGTVTSVGLLGTANQLTVTGTSPITTSGSWTLSVPSTFTFPGTVTNNLSIFGATTSAQLRGVLSDETGTGAAVFATSPTLVTPVLGTPASGNASNLTNLPITLTTTGTSGASTYIQSTNTLNVPNYATGGGEAGTPAYTGSFTGTTTTITAVTHGQGAHPNVAVFDATGLAVSASYNCKTSGGSTIGCADATSNGDLVIGSTGYPLVSGTYTYEIYGATGGFANPMTMAQDIIIGGSGGSATRLAAVNAVTFSATPTFDLSLGRTQTITLTANVTSSSLANNASGVTVTFHICQDATGSRTFVWPASILGGMTIGSTASKCSNQTFTSDGTSLYADSPGMTNM